MSVDEYPPIPVGTYVATLTKNRDEDEWNEDATAECRWEARGFVVAYSDSHGLCYKVRHWDSATAWYTPAELRVLTKRYVDTL